MPINLDKYIFLPYCLHHLDFMHVILNNNILNLKQKYYIKHIIQQDNWGLNSYEYVDFINKDSNYNDKTLINKLNYTQQLVLTLVTYTPTLNNLLISPLTQNFTAEIFSSPYIQQILQQYECALEPIPNQANTFILKANWLVPFLTYNPILAIKYGSKDYLPQTFDKDNYQSLENYQKASKALTKFKQLQNHLQMELYTSEQPIMLWPCGFILKDTQNFNFINYANNNINNQIDITSPFIQNSLNINNNELMNIIYLDFIQDFYTKNQQNNISKIIKNIEYFHNIIYNVKINYVLSNGSYIFILTPKTLAYKIFTPIKKRINEDNLKR